MTRLLVRSERHTGQRRSSHGRPTLLRPGRGSLAAIYVCKADELRLSVPLEHQIERCRARAKAGEHAVTHIAIEYAGGQAQHPSPELIQLMEIAAVGEYSNLIVIDFDSLGPEPVAADLAILLFEKLGVEIITAGDGAPDRSTRNTPLVETAMKLLKTYDAIHRGKDGP